MVNADAILMGCSSFGQVAGILSEGIKFFSVGCVGSQTGPQLRMGAPLVRTVCLSLLVVYIHEFPGNVGINIFYPRSGARHYLSVRLSYVPPQSRLHCSSAGRGHVGLVATEYGRLSVAFYLSVWATAMADAESPLSVRVHAPPSGRCGAWGFMGANVRIMAKS